MKRTLVLACALAVSTAAFGQLYKWVDKDGKVTYSDQPPATQPSKQLNLSTGQPTSAPRSAIERDKELDKSRASAKEKAQSEQEKAQRAEAQAENCRHARNYLRMVTEGGRLSTYDEKGERTLLDDQQIEAERGKARKAVDEACKAS